MSDEGFDAFDRMDTSDFDSISVPEQRKRIRAILAFIERALGKSALNAEELADIRALSAKIRKPNMH